MSDIGAPPLGQITRVHPHELTEAAENPREITAERYDALKYALEADPAMMQARPIIVDAKRGDVVCGNMRLRAVKELGWTEVPVFLHEFTSDAQRREWMLRDNQEYGNYVPAELAALVAAHESSGADLALLGFSQQDLVDLKRLASGPDLPDPGDADDERLVEVWGIVIDCADEAEQSELLVEFEGRELKARALMV